MRRLLRVTRPVVMPRPTNHSRPLAAPALALCLAAAGSGLVACGDAGGASRGSADADAGATPGPLAAVAVRTFSAAGIAFDYPAAWTAYPGDADAVAGATPGILAHLGTVTVRADGTHPLAEGQLVLTVISVADPAFSILAVPPDAEPILVDYLPGYLERPASDPQTQATATLRWTLPRPGAVDRAYVITLEAREPGTADAQALVEDALSRLMYHPPAGPLPDGPKARDEAIGRALAALAADDPGFACFPVHDTAPVAIAALPGRVTLAQPVPGACSTTVEATPLRMWQARLVVRLDQPDPDPAVGAGSTVDLWVLPDGSVASWRLLPPDEAGPPP